MKIVSQSLADQVYELVKSEILKGNIKGGEKIREEELATQFGVSRTPIREALTRLAEYGLITVAPRSHAAVVKISDRAASDIAALRVELERFAIRTMTDEGFSSILNQISRYAADCQYALSVGERAKAFELDSLFHITLVSATCNEALIDVYNKLDGKIQLLRIEQNLDESKLSGYLSQHTQIIQYIKDGDREAASDLVAEHITHSQLGK